MSTKEINPYVFDAYCKTVLRNEARNCYAENRRRRKREVSFSEQHQDMLKMLHGSDVYTIECRRFYILGYLILVQDDRIAEGLIRLPKRKREIILLSYYLDFNDREIGEIVGLSKSTVKYHRHLALIALREKLEGDSHECLF